MSIIMSFNKTELDTTNSPIDETLSIMARNAMDIVPRPSSHTSRESNKLEFSATKFLRKAIYFKT